MGNGGKKEGEFRKLLASTTPKYSTIKLFNQIKSLHIYIDGMHHDDEMARLAPKASVITQ
eukprot:10817172-Ditylum_brightwellii.AAC.1